MSWTGILDGLLRRVGVVRLGLVKEASTRYRACMSEYAIERSRDTNDHRHYLGRIHGARWVEDWLDDYRVGRRELEHLTLPEKFRRR